MDNVRMSGMHSVQPSRRDLAKAGVALIGTALASCERVTSTYTYALTLHMHDQGRPREATSVVRVVNSVLAPWSSSQTPGRTHCRGEATAIALANGGALVELMIGDPNERRLLFENPRWLGFGPNLVVANREKPRVGNISRAEIESLRAGYVLAPDELPTLVYFSDRLSRTSGVAISPTGFPFEITSGVILDGVDLEFGPQKGSRRIEAILPWLQDENRTYLGNTYECSRSCLLTDAFKG